MMAGGTSSGRELCAPPPPSAPLGTGGRGHMPAGPAQGFCSPKARMKAGPLAVGLLSPPLGLPGLPVLAEGLRAPLRQGQISLRATAGATEMNRRAGKMANCECLFSNSRLRLSSLPMIPRACPSQQRGPCSLRGQSPLVTRHFPSEHRDSPTRAAQSTSPATSHKPWSCGWYTLRCAVCEKHVGFCRLSMRKSMQKILIPHFSVDDMVQS